jgi:hypothetical protein
VKFVEWIKEYYKIIFFVLGSIIISAILALLVITPPDDFATGKFSIGITLFVTVIAIPQLTVITLDDHISKSLRIEFYLSKLYWFILFFQIIIVITAIVPSFINPNSAIIFYVNRLLVFLFFSDFVFIGFYLYHLFKFNTSSTYLLRSYNRRVVKIMNAVFIHGKKKELLPQIRSMGHIGGKTTNWYEKKEIIGALKALLDALKDIKIPQCKHLKERLLKKKETWVFLVAAIAETCTAGEPHAPTEQNLIDATHALENAWDIVHEAEQPFIDDCSYLECSKALRDLTLIAIKNKYRKFDSVEDAVRVLNKINRQTIMSKDKNYHSPFNTLPMIIEVGFAIVNGNNPYIHIYPLVTELLNFYENTKHEANHKIVLLETINLMSYIWDQNNDTIESLCYIIREAESREIRETIKVSFSYYKDDVARIARFFEAVDQFKNDKKPNLFQRFNNILDKLSSPTTEPNAN